MILELLLIGGITAAIVSRANQRNAMRRFGQQNMDPNQLPQQGPYGPVQQQPVQPTYQQIPNARQLALEESQARATYAQKSAQAAASMVQLDDTIRSGEEELNFAHAEFGKTATQRFENALDEAKFQIAESYALRQKVDNGQYSSLKEADGYLDEINGRCAEAQQMISIERSVFDNLRAQSVNAAESLQHLHEEVQEKKEATAASAKLVARLNEVYSDDALQVIEDNVSQASGRIEFAEEKISEAQEIVNSGNNTAAVMKIRYAEQALTQAQQLIDSVQRRSADLQSAARALNTSIAESTQEVVDAEIFSETSKDPEKIHEAVENLRSVLAGIKSGADNHALAPFDASRKLEAARTSLSETVTEVRDSETKKKRAAESLDHALLVARSQISATEDFIMARRGAVGADARVKLAQAQNTLDSVNQYEKTDPVRALELAQQADSLASEGGAIAKNDVDDFGSTNSNQDQPTTGAILGGMLVDNLLNKNKGQQRRNWNQ